MGHYLYIYEDGLNMTHYKKVKIKYIATYDLLYDVIKL